MCTSETCAARSRPSLHVLITSWPCRGSGTASPTPVLLDPQLGERLDHERALSDTWVRDHQARLADALVIEEEDVDVDHSRTPTSCGLPAAFALHLFGCLQEPARRPVPLGFDHLVQEPRLVRDAPRLGLDDLALSQYAYALLT